MLEDFLARIFVNQWVVFGFVTILLIALAEVGYRLGIVSRRRNPDAASGHSGSVQGAVLGLLGLLLGFSFAMSVGRFESRRDLLLQEANTIGTTWLRADFLPAPYDRQVKDLLLRYTNLRIDGFPAMEGSELFRKTRAEVAEIHRALWQCADAAVEAKPTPAVVSFVSSLNETIDLDASRLAARRNRVPGAVWLLLLAVASCSAWASGYSSGVNNTRSVFSELAFPLLIGVVITLIADIDRPVRGLVGVSVAPLEDLLETIRPEPLSGKSR
ncbi:MAG: hypothetical protein MUC40_08630 [Akkermansiaceae bacterium]|jgi:hypothetical protein|nr:hypothetical protein [Akkermansiaceae bacterium]